MVNQGFRGLGFSRPELLFRFTRSPRGVGETHSVIRNFSGDFYLVLGEPPG